MEAGSKLVSRKKKKEHEISLSPKVGLESHFSQLKLTSPKVPRVCKVSVLPGGAAAMSSVTVCLRFSRGLSRENQQQL